MSRLNSKFQIGEKTIGVGSPPYVIAEMACAHDGVFDNASALVEAAHVAGADAIQLQLFVPEHTVTPQHEVFTVLQKIAFSEEQWTELFQKGKQLGLDVWICTYDMPSVALAKRLGADGIKLNSADLSNPEILAAVAESGIPFTIGTGASTVDEVRSALALVENHGARSVVLMHGVQNFPTKIPDLNVSRVAFLRHEFPGVPVGYADHTDAIEPLAKVIDLMALGFGACLLEKHIVLDRGKKGLDHQAALEPEEFRDYVRAVRAAAIAIGPGRTEKFSESDLRYRKFQKKSVVAARAIPEGHEIRREDVLFLRNATPGISPAELGQVLRKRSLRPIAVYENITPEDVR